MGKSPTGALKGQRQAIEAAITALINALGHSQSPHVRQTPRRVAQLWQQVLLAGEGQDLAQSLRTSLLPAHSKGSIGFGPLPIHMVCPHHLTISWGQAWLGYVPGPWIVGLGKLSHLVQTATARMILQEEATTHILHILCESLQPKAAWIRFLMHHPCHWLHEPSAKPTLLCTEESYGSPKAIEQLRKMAQPGQIHPMPLPVAKPKAKRAR